MFSHRTAWNLDRNRFTEALEEHTVAGRELLDLTISNPTKIGLTYSADELLQAFTDRGALTYEPVARGMASARNAVVTYYSEKGSLLAAEDITLTTSTSEAYSFVFRLLCDPGDSLLVPTPGYPLFDFLADLNDVRLAPYELVYDDGWQIDFNSLRWAMNRVQSKGGRCRAVLVVHPNNPTGSYLKPSEIAELNRLCSANELSVIADEVFLDFDLDGTLHRSFTTNTEVLTFTLSGLSKISGLPQMKLAWVATTGPEPLQQEALARLEVIADTYLSLSAPAQLALPRMLAERHAIQPQLTTRVRANLAELDLQLASQNLCQRLAVEGGWCVVLRVPMLGSAEDLAIALMRRTGVLLQPGHFYNFSGEGYLVASLITPSRDFSEGIRRALQFVGGR